MKLFQKFFKKAPTLVMIHGFGERRTHEFDFIRTYFNNKNIDLMFPELFDQTNPDDTDPHMWIKRAEMTIEEALQRGSKVILLGYSMGGVIATHCANKYNIEKLVLIAPSFEYITFKVVKKYVAGKFVPRVVKPLPPQGPYPPLPKHFEGTFTEVVSICKPTLKNIDIPTLIFHGSNDQTIPPRSSDYAYENIPYPKKKKYLLEGAGHRILDDPDYRNDVFNIIENFINE